MRSNANEEKIDPTKSALGVVREARAEGLSVDFERGVRFKPAPVIMVIADMMGLTLAVTQDKRLWVGPRAELEVGMTPTIHHHFVGANIRSAGQQFERYIEKCREVKDEQA